MIRPDFYNLTMFQKCTRACGDEQILSELRGDPESYRDGLRKMMSCVHQILEEAVLAFAERDLETTALPEGLQTIHLQ